MYGLQEVELRGPDGTLGGGRFPREELGLQLGVKYSPGRLVYPFVLFVWCFASKM